LEHAREWCIKNGYNKIVTYSDCRFGNGNVYKINGFNFVRYIGDFYWTNMKERFHWSKYCARNGKSEKQITEEVGVCRIYGAGNYLWEFPLQIENSDKNV